VKGHAATTGEYERQAPDLTELDQLYQVAPHLGRDVEVVIEDGIPPDMEASM